MGAENLHSVRKNELLGELKILVQEHVRKYGWVNRQSGAFRMLISRLKNLDVRDDIIESTVSEVIKEQ